MEIDELSLCSSSSEEMGQHITDSGRLEDNEEVSSDSNVWIIDEEELDSDNISKPSHEAPDPKYYSLNPPNIMEDLKYELLKSREEEKKPKRPAEGKEGKKGKKKALEDLLSCPMNIIASITRNSNYKCSDLSEILDEKFQVNRLELASALKDVKYLPTVKDLGDDFSEATSIKPLGFMGQINLSPFSFINLNCIYDKPPKRWRRGKKNQKNAAKQNNAKKTNQPKPEQESNVNPTTESGSQNHLHSNSEIATPMDLVIDS